MKFVVGVMLTAFGTFWGAEGAGARWPGSDAALLVLAPGIAVFALGLVALLRRVPDRAAASRRCTDMDVPDMKVPVTWRCPDMEVP